MTVNPMIEEGGTRVLDENGKTIGFVFTEPVRGAPESQIQRWILLGTEMSYRFEKCTIPCKETWKKMVTTPAPSGEGPSWGKDPEKGLWVKRALYVVAQSTLVTKWLPGQVPSPTYPKCAGALFPPSSDAWPRKCDSEQIIIDRVGIVNHRGNIVGHCFGDLTEDALNKQLFTSAEYVFISERESEMLVGADTPWKSIKRGKDKCKTARAFHDNYVKNYGQPNRLGGTRYDVIGCCYYRSGDKPPPGNDKKLETFLFG
ncbi:hypothetical protein WMF45_05050 [Sorangium sp. So ce448]|uniref:hypothetical protein n=1 Tax=Sorangium sp. So ce448 TaxID=3133314 RepID=UPI003F5D62A8